MSQYIEVGALFPTLQTKLATSTSPLATAVRTTIAPLVPTTMTAAAPQESFLSKYGAYLLIGAVAVGGFVWWRRRRAGGRK